MCHERAVQGSLSELETRLMEQYGVSLNEAMALCCIGGDTLTASVYRKTQVCLLRIPLKSSVPLKRKN